MRIIKKSLKWLKKYYKRSGLNSIKSVIWLLPQKIFLFLNGYQNFILIVKWKLQRSIAKLNLINRN